MEKSASVPTAPPVNSSVGTRLQEAPSSCFRKHPSTFTMVLPDVPPDDLSRSRPLYLPSKEQKIQRDVENVKEELSEGTNEEAADVIENSKTEEAAEFIEHPKKELTVKYLVQCDQCASIFRNPSILKQHKKRLHSEERSYVCNECDKGHVTKRELICHMAVHTGKKAFPGFMCVECGKEFFHKIDLNDHQRSHEGINIVCDQCGKTFAYGKHLRTHIKFVHEGFRVSCVKCGKKYMSRHGLSQHNKSQSCESIPEANKNVPIIKESTNCQECEATFKIRSALKRHMATHKLSTKVVDISAYIGQSENGKPLCKECGKEFNWKHALYSHVRMIHFGYYEKNIEKNQPYPCEIEGCDSKFSQDNSLKRHQERSHGVTEKSKSPKDMRHSDSQLKFLNDVMSELSGNDLTKVLAYFRRLKEAQNDKLFDEIISNQTEALYRPTMIKLGILDATEMEDCEVSQGGSLNQHQDRRHDVTEKNESQKDMHHSDSQFKFMNDVMSEFTGNDLAKVLTYFRSVKEAKKDKFFDEVIANKTEALYRPIMMKLGILDATVGCHTIMEMSPNGT